jgi:hypothetical protein
LEIALVLRVTGLELIEFFQSADGAIENGPLLPELLQCIAHDEVPPTVRRGLSSFTQQRISETRSVLILEQDVRE